MNFNFVTNLESCHFFISQNADFLNLIYYSHVPTALASLIIGLFILFKSKKNLVAKLLFFITLAFSLWSFFDLSIWTQMNSVVLMFLWSLLGILDLLVFIFCLYFVYVYIDKKDVSLNKKYIFLLLLLPVIIMTPSHYNLIGFDTVNCEAKEFEYFTGYYYFTSFVIFFWILCLIISRYRKALYGDKQKIILLAIGMGFFLLAFLITGFSASIIDDFRFELYGLFGMPIFLGFLAYLIVRYKAFNIKLIGAQALVIALNLLIASQFFFIQSSINIILTGITLSISLGFGYVLIKSVKKEVERKEELQKLTEKLSRANVELKKLDSAKTEFISIASHQLRTPITAIKGFSSLVLEGTYGETSQSVHGAMEKIFGSAQRLLDLVEDLLNVSRIESGRMQFDFRSGNIEKILKELYDNFSLIAKNKNLYLNYNPSAEPLPEIEMDAGKIRELISNFVDNALKYTEAGGVTISVELRNDGVVVDESGFVIEGKKSQFGKVVRITVADTGIGIPKDEIPYLFKKFSRGKDVSRLHVGGTGLGLYVGKAITEAHHGQVWIESAGAGKGSKFIIEIPTEHVK